MTGRTGPTRYEIEIGGHASDRVLRPVVDEFTIERTESGTTRLVGVIRDSSHLNGLLAHFTALTVEVVGLHRLDDPSGGTSADRDPHPERQQP